MSKENFLAKYGSEKHLKDIFDKDEPGNHLYYAIKNPLTTKEQLLNLSEKDHGYQHQVYSDSRLDSNDLHKLLKDTTNLALEYVFHNRNADSSHVEVAIQHHKNPVKFAALRSDKITHSQIDRILDSDGPLARKNVMRNRNVTENHLLRGIKDEYPHVQDTALHNRNATSKVVKHALEHGDHSLKQDAILHPKANDEDLEKFAKNENEDEHLRNMASKVLSKRYGGL